MYEGFGNAESSESLSGIALVQVPGVNGPNTAGVTGAESPLPRSPLVFGPFTPGTCRMRANFNAKRPLAILVSPKGQGYV